MDSLYGAKILAELVLENYNLGQNKWKTETPPPPQIKDKWKTETPPPPPPKKRMGKWRVFALRGA